MPGCKAAPSLPCLGRQVCTCAVHPVAGGAATPGRWALMCRSGVCTYMPSACECAGGLLQPAAHASVCVCVCLARECCWGPLPVSSTALVLYCTFIGDRFCKGVCDGLLGGPVAARVNNASAAPHEQENCKPNKQLIRVCNSLAAGFLPPSSFLPHHILLEPHG